MRISQIIKDLQRVQETHGDVLIYVSLVDDKGHVKETFLSRIICDPSLNQGDPIEEKFFLNLIIEKE